MPNSLSSTTIIALIVIAVGCVLIWWILNSNRSRAEKGSLEESQSRSGGTLDRGTTPSGFAASVEQGDFDVILQSPGDMQVLLIKEIRVITKLGLLETKQLVDTAPSLILKGVSEETALRAKEKLEAAGASVVIK